MIANFGTARVEYRKKTTSRPAGIYALVKNDYDMVWDGGVTRVSRNTRNEILGGKVIGSQYNKPSGKAVPATARFLDDTFVSFTCELQHWFHKMNVDRALPYGASEAGLKADFASCFRDNVWFSNKAGTWTREDCINQNGLPPYVQLQPMATGGAVLRVVGETAWRRVPCYLVEAINPQVTFTTYTVKDHRWLFFHPTLSARYWLEFETGNDGHPDRTTKRQEWYQEPMHFYKEQTIAPVFGFIKDPRSATGFVNVIEKSRVRILGENEEIPNPFIMRFGREVPNPYAGF